MSYFPKQGDIIWIDMNPQAGRETAKRRPALVVSGNEILRYTGSLAKVCPITSSDNHFPLHIPLDEASAKITGFVMCEQEKALDLAARNAVYIDSASQRVLEQVLNILRQSYD